ncbi:MAG: helicase [Nitratireductor sp.]|nr:helicase [Nitratireductor sp.]
MASHSSGLIGLPLRLLAREVYQRLCDKVGVARVALVTGEEKIAPPGARFQVCTVEAMPAETDAAFVAIDEVQLAADLERGHIFTDRMMNLRGREETLLLGAETMQGALRQLLPGIEIVTRPRMSMLTHAGSKKITRLAQRSAIVTFSANEVYAIAELVRRQRGGAAVVLGSLSPRTRNAQVALYQSGEVDFLVATDAIGMGLNLDVDHVAFAQDRKFDGFQHRRLTAAEMGQIAGRAGRHMRDGTFGTTGKTPPFEDELVEQLETHTFQPVKVLTWRNRELDFASIDALRASLDRPSGERLLMKALPASDVQALERLSRDPFVADACGGRDTVRLLWEVCCIPDYRKISPGNHAELLQHVFSQIATAGRIDPDWFARQVKAADRTEGDIDALSARIAQIRTWTYLSHRNDWLADALHWQQVARDIEDRLSDALHEALTKRFIDRRTSQLLRKLRDNAHMEAEIEPTGEVKVEGHLVGRLSGFRFTPDMAGQSPEAKAANAAAMKVLAGEMEKRAGRLAASANTDFILDSEGSLRWHGEAVARLTAGEDYLKPRVILLADEQLTGPARDSVANRLERWVHNHLANVLKPLVEMTGDQTLEGLARGLAYRLVEAQGNIDRREIAEDVQGLSQDMRAGLRRHGVRFGAYTVFAPSLLKPAPAELLCLLWAIANEKLDAPGRSEVLQVLSSGRTSTVHERDYEREFYRICGYRILGAKAVRIDILERLADLIRPALFYRPDNGQPKPDGAIDGRGFYVTPAMLSILGATHEDMELVLKGLGYRGEPRPESEVRPQVTAAETGAADAGTAAGIGTEGAAPEATPEAGPAVAPAEALEPAAESIEAGAIAVSEAVVEAADGESAGEAQGEPGQASEAALQADVQTGVQAAEEEGPKTVLVWRPAPRHHGNRHRGERGGGKRAEGNTGAGEDRGEKRGKGGRQQGRHKAGKGDGQGGKFHQKDGGKPTRQHRGGDAGHSAAARRKPERFDPDSPFAKLAALKEDLKKGV